MTNKTLLPLARQKELIAINRILAILVVGLTFTSGYLVALREEWFTKKTEPTPIPAAPADQSSVGLPIGGGANTPLFTILKNARYSRVFTNQEISREVLFSLLYAAQGKITAWGERTVPSYKSQYPIRLEVLVRRVTGVTPGLYWFNPSTQTLEPAKKVLLNNFTEPSPGLNEAPIVMIANATKERLTDSNTLIEAGGIAQNILLAGSEAHLATYYVPAVNLTPTEIAALALPENDVVWLMPVSSTTPSNTSSNTNTSKGK